METEIYFDLLKTARQKAFNLSSSNRIGNVLQKVVELSQDLIKSDADPEKLKLGLASLKAECDLAMIWDNERENSSRDIAYGLSKSFERIMDWLITRGISQKDISDKHKFLMETNEEDVNYDNDSQNFLLDGDYIADKGPSALSGHATTKSSKKGRTEPCNFKCEACGKQFITNRNLTVHRRIHLDNDKERLPQKCKECGRRFGTKDTLIRHMKTHIDENLTGDLEKFKCEICGKQFNWKHILTVHQKMHIDNDETRLPYKCEECGRRFAIKGNLINHKIIHSGNKESRRHFKCIDCGKIYNWQKDLNRHTRSHQ